MKKLLYSVLVVALLLAGCAPAVPPVSGDPTAEPAAAEGNTLTVLVHDSFSASEDVLAEFETANQVKVSFVKGGDAGSMLNRAVLSKEAPLADVLYGVDNTFLSRALSEDIFEAYQSPELSAVTPALVEGLDERVTPVDYGDVCINYDRAWFAEKQLALPETLEDLAQPEYKDLLVTENPATSSTGLAFLLATIAHFGPEGYLDYWTRLKDNGLTVVSDWETAYYTNFSASSGKGPQPMAVSYGSSPAVEVVFASEPLDESPTASLVGPDMCFRQVEYVGILKGTPRRALAEKFVDFMLSKRFQEDVPLQMYVFPARADATLPEVYVKHSQIPEQPVLLDPAQIDQNRDAWIAAWTEVVLK